MFPELNKSYEPGGLEARWSRAWIEGGWFHADAGDPRETWSLVIPPPNVTGSLHMGHMLEHTLIDAVVRWQRMRGKATLWLPGTDHAGIATQMVVERQLAAQGRDRRAMGREAFVAAVWEWKQQSGDRIKEQMMRLGASCDWTRERFTLDPGLSRAVREVFVTLYEEGLIHRGLYMVNWCPGCRTAVSDLEVNHTDTVGKLYRVRYRSLERRGEFLTVATTRPETILADVAVAVNPADERYRGWIGSRVEVPLTGRAVPVIGDEIARMEFGTGAVKITPGHDANDYAAGERHGLEILTVIDESGRMSEAAGAYAGLDRFEARARVVADLEEAGLLAGADEHPLALGQCQRCGTVIEPRVSRQWFVKTAPLAAEAVAAVEAGLIRIVPDNNRRVFLEWMANIRDWCISRQLWWGHRIPAWYCDACHTVIVARHDPSACDGCGGALRQDPDVLDTWFSSGLWPFSTLGWPEKTADLARFYPTSLLITGFDILFFWVARMAMLGIHFMKRDGRAAADAVPFREVYIHALVRDADRQKMSKTKGNVIDPLEVTAKYGTDAVRFTLAAMAAPGTDIALSEARMQGYAAFANKIWNAARFLFLSLDRLERERGWQPPAIDPHAAAQAEGDELADRWLFSRLNAVTATVDRQLGEYRFHDAADALYHFIWHEFCDWYIELAKLRLHGEGDATAVGNNLLRALETWLRLLHPFMPFATEELWQAAHRGNPPQATIALAAWPAAGATDAEAEAAMALLQAVVTAARGLKAEAKLPPKAHPPVRIAARQPERLRPLLTTIQALANLGETTLVEHLAPAASGHASHAEFEMQMDLGGLVDTAAERLRLEKEAAQLRKSIENARRQLANESFRGKAPAAVIAETERLAEEMTRKLAQAESALGALGR